MSYQLAEFGKNGESHINRFFLACEWQPGTNLFGTIEGFVYDIEPAYIYGGLGTLHYDPSAYGIVSVSPESEPLFGYVFTITHPDTIAFMDRVKGFISQDGINHHIRISTEERRCATA